MKSWSSHQRYPFPDSEIRIEDICEQIKLDYLALEKQFALPARFQFKNLLKVVCQGMADPHDYPFKHLQKEFISYIVAKAKQESDWQNGFEVFTAVWNYFPHSDLGMSPTEKSMEEQENAGFNGSDKILSSLLPSKVIDGLLLSLQEYVDEKLVRRMESIGLTKREVNKIKSMLANPEADPGDALMYIFESVISKSRQSNKNKQTNNFSPSTIDLLQPVVRSLTFAENHVCSRMLNGALNSRMFASILEKIFNTVKDESEERLQTDFYIPIPIFVLENLVDTINLISLDGKTLGFDDNYIDASHHVVNWIPDVDLAYLSDMPPQQLAGLAMGVAIIISEIVTPKENRPCTVVDIYNFYENNFKNEKDFISQVKILTEATLYVCSDPLMFVPNILVAPDNYLRRLEDVAPDIRLRSDPADYGSIPSPFEY